jgi:hypothetical protein
METAYDGQQVVGMDLHPHRSVRMRGGWGTARISVRTGSPCRTPVGHSRPACQAVKRCAHDITATKPCPGESVKLSSWSGETAHTCDRCARVRLQSLAYRRSP